MFSRVKSIACACTIDTTLKTAASTFVTMSCNIGTWHTKKKSEKLIFFLISQVILLCLNLPNLRTLSSPKCIHTSVEVINVQLTLHNVCDDIIVAIYKTAHEGDFDNKQTDFSCPWSYVTTGNRMQRVLDDTMAVARVIILSLKYIKMLRDIKKKNIKFFSSFVISLHNCYI